MATDSTTLHEICRSLHGIFPADYVKKALIVLLQHHCVFVEQLSSAEANKDYQYRVDRQMVINRLFFPSFLAAIKSQFGEVGVEIAECLMDHGQASLQHVLDECQKGVILPNITPQQIETTFEAMVESRFLVVVPPFAPILVEQPTRDSSVIRTPSTAASATAPDDSSQENKRKKRLELYSV